MKTISIIRLPPILIANIIALFRILGLIANAIFEKAYLRAFFGPEAKISGAANFSTAHWAFQYLVPIAPAWIIGLLFAIGYNAVVKFIGNGLRVDIEE